MSRSVQARSTSTSIPVRSWRETARGRPMAWVDGQAVLITGGASGLGRALARRFSAEGAWVGILDRSEAGLRSFRDEIGETAIAVEGDVRELRAHESAVQA